MVEPGLDRHECDPGDIGAGIVRWRNLYEHFTTSHLA
jgi:hypothetical protein